MTTHTHTSAHRARRKIAWAAGFVALFGTACGTTSVTDSAPVISTTTTVVARNDVGDDKAAVDQLKLLLGAAMDAGFENIQMVRVDGVNITVADQPSIGPNAVSLATYHTQTTYDIGLAIRSNSGSCLWFASVGGEERYGVGEPCTGLTALHESTHEIPNDSPWRVVVGAAPDPSDPQALYGLQANAAQSVLRNALVAAKVYFSDSGTFRGMSAAALQEIEPGLAFVADTPSADAHTVSVVVKGNRFGAAVLADNGTCYWITENVAVSGTRYGEGTPCTGTAALDATADTWAAVS